MNASRTTLVVITLVCLAGTKTAQAQVDLVADSLGYNPDTQLATLGYTVSSPANVGAYNIEFYLDADGDGAFNAANDTEVGADAAGNAAPGVHTLARDYSANPPAPGQYIFAVMDRAGSVVETNEGNNNASHRRTGVPEYLNMQGRLTDASGFPVADDTYQLTFRLYDAASGGALLWTEVNSVVTTEGVFSAELGHNTMLDPIFNMPYWVSVQVESDAEMPRLPLNSVPYALRAKDAESVEGSPLSDLVRKDEADSVSTVMIQAAAVTNAKLAASSVGTTQLQDACVTNVKLADSAVATAKLADNAVASAKLAADSVSTAKLQNSAVTTAKLANAAVTTAQLGSIAGYSLNTSYNGTLLTLINSYPSVLSTLVCRASFNNGTAINGYADDLGIGVLGGTWTGVGVKGWCDNTTSAAGDAVFGYSKGGKGVHAKSDTGIGVYSETASSDLFIGYSSSASNTRFRVTNAGNVQADGTYTSPAADFAEMMPVEGALTDYEPGDVLMIGDQAGRVARSNEPNSTRLIGVYSTVPAFLGGAAMDPGSQADHRVPVAVVGIVPVKVSGENGPIRVGDLLTSASLPGRAMKADMIKIGGVRIHRPGAILGKALEPFDGKSGTIKVFVMSR